MIEQKGKLKEILSMKNVDDKEDALYELSDKLSKKIIHRLDDNDISLLRNVLVKEKVKDGGLLRALWIIACNSQYDEEIGNFSIRILEKSKYQFRNYGFMYLRIHKPYMIDKLIEKYINDDDPSILYEIAQVIGENDIQKMVDMIIEIYPKANSHELHDSFDLEIYEQGDLNHLEKMKKIIADNPMMNDIYKNIIYSLEEKLIGEK